MVVVVLGLFVASTAPLICVTLARSIVSLASPVRSISRGLIV